jgi:hypothetical protein
MILEMSSIIFDDLLMTTNTFGTMAQGVFAIRRVITLGLCKMIQAGTRNSIHAEAAECGGKYRKPFV